MECNAFWPWKVKIILRVLQDVSPSLYTMAQICYRFECVKNFWVVSKWRICKENVLNIGSSWNLTTIIVFQRIWYESFFVRIDSNFCLNFVSFLLQVRKLRKLIAKNSDQCSTFCKSLLLSKTFENIKYSRSNLEAWL